MAIDTVEELTTFKMTAQLQDEDGDSLTLSELDAMVLEVYESRTETIVRSKRDAKNINDVTITSPGVLTWLGQIEDTRIVNSDTRLGGIEQHVAQFEYAFGNLGSQGSETDPFTTTSGSNLITVSWPGHGLTTPMVFEDHVFFVTGDTVGGLNLNGRFRVHAIADGDNFTIVHKCSASSAEGPAGGNVSMWVNGRVGLQQVIFPVRPNRS